MENIKSNFAITGCRVGGSGKGQGLQLGWLAGRDGWIVECMGEGGYVVVKWWIAEIENGNGGIMDRVMGLLKDVA